MGDGGLTEYDFMVLVAFDAKIHQWGFRRLDGDEWPPRFETPALNERATSLAEFKKIKRENDDVIRAWRVAHAHDRAKLINAHLDEERERRLNRCLWAVRHVGRVDILRLESLDLAREYLDPEMGGGFTILARDEPGGAWVEYAPAAQKSAAPTRSGGEGALAAHVSCDAA